MTDEILEIPISKIKESKLNPRTEIDKTGLGELADSIREVGVLQPLLVRPHDGEYEIVCGTRRLRACKIAGLEKVPTIVRDLTDDEVIELTLIENAQREDLNDVEKGKTCIELLEKFKEKYPTRDILARRLGISNWTLNRWIGVAEKVPTEIQEMISTYEKPGAPVPKGKITSQVALQITQKITDTERQIEVAREFAEKTIPVHKARIVLSEVAKASDEPVQDVVQKVLTAPPDFQLRLSHAAPVIQGVKTQTSRFLRSDEVETLKPGVIVKANIWQPAFAELEVVNVEKKRLGDFTDEDAEREGGYTLEEFKSVWESIHGKGSWFPNREVVVIQYKVAKSQPEIIEYLRTQEEGMGVKGDEKE